ncbi:MAG: copper amine oxidase N-terminal domain-containing protein [Oscillospiraceae bacterium]|nr:copper amine oxidase N-terminal domain-containing protein [Oscillospiraceae bacterium]
MKKILAMVVAAVVIVGVIGVLAMPAEVPESTMTERFTVVEGVVHSDTQFSMISEDGELIIFINDDVEVLFEDYVPLGDDVEGYTRDAREVLFGRTLAEVLDGRTLTITYNFIGMSIPANTTPTTVVIMFETAVPLPGIEIETGEGYENIVTLPEDIGDLDWDFEIDFDDVVLNGEIVVNGEIIDAPAPFWSRGGYTEDGIAVTTATSIMVPLRAVAEALGYEVSWSEETQSIMLGVGVHVFIGRAEAYLGRMAPIELSTAPIIVENLTFVPMDFFRNVLGQTVYSFEGQLVIETYSDMY